MSKKRTVAVFLVVVIVSLAIVKYLSIEPKDKRERIFRSRNAEHLLSPAYGKITGIRDQGNGLTRISIFLGPWDVHEQYMPCAGMIRAQQYKPGEFNNALFFEKTEKNERMDTLIVGTYGLVAVSQIAGQIFRTIESDVKENQNLEQGDKLGRIKFGSRVDLVVPNLGTRLLTRVGDRVVGAETPLAVWT